MTSGESLVKQVRLKNGEGIFIAEKKGADVCHVAWEILWEQIVCQFQGFLPILPILHERPGSVSTFCHANYLSN